MRKEVPAIARRWAAVAFVLLAISRPTFFQFLSSPKNWSKEDPTMWSNSLTEELDTEACAASIGTEGLGCTEGAGGTGGAGGALGRGAAVEGPPGAGGRPPLASGTPNCPAPGATTSSSISSAWDAVRPTAADAGATPPTSSLVSSAWDAPRPTAAGTGAAQPTSSVLAAAGPAAITSGGIRAERMRDIGISSLDSASFGASSAGADPITSWAAGPAARASSGTRAERILHRGGCLSSDSSSASGDASTAAPGATAGATWSVAMASGGIVAERMRDMTSSPLSESASRSAFPAASSSSSSPKSSTCFSSNSSAVMPLGMAERMRALTWTSESLAMFTLCGMSSSLIKAERLRVISPAVPNALTSCTSDGSMAERMRVMWRRSSWLANSSVSVAGTGGSSVLKAARGEKGDSPREVVAGVRVSAESASFASASGAPVKASKSVCQGSSTVFATTGGAGTPSGASSATAAGMRSNMYQVPTEGFRQKRISA
mmetsp:Transcript_77504/g.239292  ORF Transcript_77504/g.239292 Transcript_77504/m.239292 type:complete len:489 (+) Transcript_77504:620-2086(+)